ncbi:MAG: hypothetical protein JWM27_2380 [Gemmatimonadetes bacterium]|nr:hypothetical protein [Gemmatimonadota bacterium]
MPNGRFESHPPDAVSTVRPLLRPAAEALRLAPARPAWKAGLRVAAATLVPVLVGQAFGYPGTSWLMLGGFSAALADKGGAYRSRFASMAGFAVIGAVSIAIGGLAGHHAGAAVLLAFAGTAALALLRVYGPSGTTVGLLATFVLLVSLASPSPDAADAMQRSLALGAGSAWAMVLALLLWPIRVYRPGRLAVAASLRAVADFVAEITRLAEAGGADGWSAGVPAHHAAIRQSLEEARATLAAIRRSRQGESGRGEGLLVMLQSADRLVPALVALEFVLEGIARDGGVPAGAIDALRAVDAVLRETAAAAESERPCRVPRPGVWAEDAWARLMDGLRHATVHPARAAQLAHAADLLRRLHEYVEAGADTAEGLAEGRTFPAAADPGAAAGERTPLLAPLRAVLSPGSVVLRHALRVGAAAAAAEALTTALGIPRGYWATLTVVVVLQPYTGATLVKGFQRVAGTVLGGLMAALAGAAIQDERGIMVVVAVTAVVGVAMQPINYAAYSAFLTPTFVLQAEMGAHDWHLVHLRVLNTLLGGAIALIGAFVLWPSPETARLPALAAEAIRRSGAYLDRALGAMLGGDPGGLAGLRREAGLAATNAEASFQRLLSESARDDAELEPWMATLAYVRRLTAAATALATGRRLGTPNPDAVAAFRADAGRTVAELADAVEHTRPPAPMPDLRADAERAPLLRTALERVARQLAVLHAAATRLHAAPEPAAAASAERPEAHAVPHADSFRP